MAGGTAGGTSGPGSGATAIAVGINHACAIVVDGGVVCWGLNTDGQLGATSGMFSNGVPGSALPLPVANLPEPAVTLLATDLSCATGLSSVRCWGRADEGQRGDAGTGSTPTDLGLVAPAALSKLAGGPSHTCALTLAGTVFCWGQTDVGNLLSDGGTRSSAPVQVPIADAVDLSVSFTHSCAVVRDGGVWCWGQNGQGELGRGVAGLWFTTPAPIRFDGGAASQVSVSERHSCARLLDGTALCWGLNLFGELGTPVALGSSLALPTTVPGLAGVTQIRAGNNYTCAVLSGGGLRCWGRNVKGQLGSPLAPASTYTPTNPGLSGVVEVSTGPDTACARLVDGGVRCWGSNSFGQTGTGGSPMVSDFVTTPQAVVGL